MMRDLLDEARVELDDVRAPNAHSNRYLLEEEAMVTCMAMYAAVAIEVLNR